MIEVPQVFAREIVDRQGEAGARWIASLPALVDELAERWGCAPTGSVMHAVMHAYRGRKSGRERGVELAERAATVLA
jgi:hypothetical protein